MEQIDYFGAGTVLRLLIAMEHEMDIHKAAP